MKLTINQHNNITEEEIIINCAYVDPRMQRLIDYVRQYTFSLEGEYDSRIYHVPIDEILYMDCVDGKTFFYNREHAFLCRQSLTALETQLLHTPFTRISKNCLLNTSYLKCVSPYANHRLKAELHNEEQLLISRNYIDSLKEKLKG